VPSREASAKKPRVSTAKPAPKPEPKPKPKVESDLRKHPWASPEISRLSRYSWIAGVAGMFTLLSMGYLAWSKDALHKGWGLVASDKPVDQNVSMAFVLLVVASVMFLVELAIRFQVDGGRVVRVSPDIREGRIGRFIGECLLVYLVELGMFQLVFAFYRTVAEYGWNPNGGGYYKPWFTVMQYIWQIYLYGGLPYVLLTRALQHDAKSDRKQGAFVLMKAARWLSTRFSNGGEEVPRFDRYDRSAILGLCVKGFFVPLMTVFFVDQFSHLVSNMGFLFGGTRNGFTVRDFHNVSYTIVFSVDVGIAWCGYVLSSRWIKNTIHSAEPTMLGWVVALFCYPSWNGAFGRYSFPTAGESAFFNMGSPRAIAILAVMSALSFTVYASATVVFGLRFSNLTHRGIITTGPYALVRHPAYAAKNFSWWCVMFPVTLYNAGAHKSLAPLVQVLGLVVLTGMYYMRAITEERHLRRDPEYRAYMKKVPYRFIPGVI
jgi:protein-S-isoprenylcysteine O-methyltransferase Ste14